MAHVKLNSKHFLISAIFWFDAYFSKYPRVSKLQNAQVFQQPNKTWQFVILQYFLKNLVLLSFKVI